MMNKVQFSGEQKAKVKKAKALISLIRDTLNEVHPEWEDCDSCCSPMEYLLKEDLFTSKSLDFQYIRDRIRVVLRHIKKFPVHYKKISEKYLEIYHR